MPKENLTEIAIIMDESGSMQSTASDAIGGFNSFIESQKKIEGEAKVTLVLFDEKYEIVYEGLDLNKVPTLNDNTYTPGGSTALVDALGRTVDSLFDRINAIPESDQPSKVIIIVITDGEENASREYKASEVSSKIKDYKSRLNWEVVFIGASADVLDQAKDLGISLDRTYGYSGTSEGTKALYRSLGDSVAEYRCSGDFSDI